MKNTLQKFLVPFLAVALLIGSSVFPSDASARRFVYIRATAGTSYDTDAQTYINAVIAAGGTLNSTQQAGIDRWVRDMKGESNGSYSTYNVWSRIMWAYLFTQGHSAARDGINAKNPGTYNFTDTGSPTYSSGTLSVAYNGSSQYSDTNHTPNGEFTTFANSDLTGIGVHRVDTNNDTNATIGEVGGGNTYMVTSATFETMLVSGSTAINQAQTRSVNRLWASSWSDSGHVNAYYNGANIKTTTATWGNTASRSVYLGAFHGASPGYGGANTIDFAYGVKGAWSDAEQQMMYDATKALKAALGITWS